MVQMGALFHDMRNASVIRTRVSSANPATWPALNAWMATAITTMSDLFRPIVETLDAADDPGPITPDGMSPEDDEPSSSA